MDRGVGTMSRIGLFQVDGKWANLALMKLSAWHKARGDSVEMFFALKGGYDKVYASKVFDFTADSPYVPESAIKGGTGYDLTTCLPDEVESIFPDYNLYPWWDAAIGFTTRGCIRHCPFCLAPGTLVLTGEGLKPIESVTVGDLVLTHKGRYQPVTALLNRDYDGPILRLRADAGSSVFEPLSRLSIRSGCGTSAIARAGSASPRSAGTKQTS